jgi:hypothetical protein
MREILYTDSQDILLLSSTVASCYYNCCRGGGGSTSPGNYGYHSQKYLCYFITLKTLLFSRGSVVGKDWTRSRSWSCGKVKDFNFTISSRPTLGST